jgi:hypothetical protein
VEHSRLFYGLLAVLGIVFLTLCLVGIYLNAIDAISVFAALPSEFVLWFLSIGIFFLTVGFVGTGRQHLKSHKKLFTALAAVLVPVLTFAAMFFALTTIAFNALFIFPLRSEITQVTVVDDSPLVLSLCVKAITNRDTRIDGALILDSNNTLVASYWNEEIMVKGVSTFQPICVLPAGSEITVAVDFNTTLPSGSYLIRLSSWHDNHGESFFTIP